MLFLARCLAPFKYEYSATWTLSLQVFLQNNPNLNYYYRGSQIRLVCDIIDFNLGMGNDPS